MSSSTGQRRHSLRLPKSKSCGRMNDTVEDDEEVKRAKVKSSTIEHISRAMRSLRAGTMTSTTSNNTDAGTAGDSEKSKKSKLQRNVYVLNSLFKSCMHLYTRCIHEM